MFSLTLSKTDDSNARGRNGVFKPAIITGRIHTANRFASLTADVLRLEVESSKPGKAAPVVLQLTRDDAKRLHKEIGALLKGVRDAAL